MGAVRQKLPLVAHKKVLQISLRRERRRLLWLSNGWLPQQVPTHAPSMCGSGEPCEESPKWVVQFHQLWLGGEHMANHCFVSFC